MSRLQLAFLLAFGAVVAIMLLFGRAWASQIELKQVLSFDVPGVTTIQDYSVKDIDYDGIPEILVFGDKKVLLYSPANDSIYFEIQPPKYPSTNVLLADVNRDSVADVVIGYYNQGYDYTDSAAIIEVYDGAAGSMFQRYYYPTPPYTSYWGWYNEYYHYMAGPHFTTFCAYDLNNDGFDEFFFSYGYEVDENHPGGLEQVHRTGGTAYLYYSYPESLAWNSNNLISNATFQHFGDQSFMTANISEYVKHTGNGPDYEITTAKLNKVTTAGLRHLRLLDSVPDPAAKMLFHDYKKDTGLICRAYGQIETGNPDPDFLLYYYYRYQDLVNWDLSQTYEDRLYRAVGTDSAELIWSKAPTPLANTICLPQFPGSYFGELSGWVFQFSGATGELIDTVGSLPAGNYRWDYPFEPYQPYLMVTSGNHVAIYTITEVTDADQGEPLPIPATLSLGKPYPNPFNASQTIPITVRPGQELDVNVYNLLGQKIQTLYAGTPSAPTLNITWRADHLPSGVYFVRATSGDAVAVVRSILLK